MTNCRAYLVFLRATYSEHFIVFKPSLTVRHILIGVREWPFAGDAPAADSYDRGLSVTEYIAIGVCSILLGLIYVASVFLYLHVRRRRRVKQRAHCNGQPVHLAGPEEVVVKSNPLLSAKRHPLETSNYLSDSASCCSETDAVSDIAQTSDDSNRVPQNVSVHILPDITQLNGKCKFSLSTP